jgi:flagellum-specific ATP synthase
MGAYSAGGDPLIDSAIARRPELLEFLKQGPAEKIGFESSQAALMEAFAA